MSTGPVRAVPEGVDPRDLEGEYHTDVAEKPIPPRDTWEELSFQQLLDLQLQLEDKAWTFAKNPVISRALQQALTELRALIASKY